MLQDREPLLGVWRKGRLSGGWAYYLPGAALVSAPQLRREVGQRGRMSQAHSKDRGGSWGQVCLALGRVYMGAQNARLTMVFLSAFCTV